MELWSVITAINLKSRLNGVSVPVLDMCHVISHHKNKTEEKHGEIICLIVLTEGAQRVPKQVWFLQLTNKKLKKK